MIVVRQLFVAVLCHKLCRCQSSSLVRSERPLCHSFFHSSIHHSLCGQIFSAKFISNIFIMTLFVNLITYQSTTQMYTSSYGPAAATHNGQPQLCKKKYFLSVDNCSVCVVCDILTPIYHFLNWFFFAAGSALRK